MLARTLPSRTLLMFSFSAKKHNDTGDCTDMNNGSETDEEQTSSQRDEVQQLAY